MRCPANELNSTCLSALDTTYVHGVIPEFQWIAGHIMAQAADELILDRYNVDIDKLCTAIGAQALQAINGFQRFHAEHMLPAHGGAHHHVVLMFTMLAAIINEADMEVSALAAAGHDCGRALGDPDPRSAGPVVERVLFKSGYDTPMVDRVMSAIVDAAFSKRSETNPADISREAKSLADGDNFPKFAGMFDPILQAAIFMYEEGLIGSGNWIPGMGVDLFSASAESILNAQEPMASQGSFFYTPILNKKFAYLAEQDMWRLGCIIEHSNDRSVARLLDHWIRGYHEQAVAVASAQIRRENQMGLV